MTIFGGVAFAAGRRLSQPPLGDTVAEVAMPLWAFGIAVRRFAHVYWLGWNPGGSGCSAEASSWTASGSSKGQPTYEISLLLLLLLPPLVIPLPPPPPSGLCLGSAMGLALHRGGQGPSRNKTQTKQNTPPFKKIANPQSPVLRGRLRSAPRTLRVPLPWNDASRRKILVMIIPTMIKLSMENIFQ